MPDYIFKIRVNSQTELSEKDIVNITNTLQNRLQGYEDKGESVTTPIQVLFHFDQENSSPMTK